MTAHLEIHSPSPTTVSYVVSSKKRPTFQLLAVVRHGIRVFLVFHGILINFIKAQATFPDGGWDTYVGWMLRLTVLDRLARFIAASTEWWTLLAMTSLVLYLCLRRDYTEESLLVLQGLGIQTSTSSSYFFLSSITTFIPTTRIQDIVIHEAFKGLEVRFYLAVIVEGASEVVVVFPTLLPRRDTLEEVWRGARKCLYAGGG